MRTGDERRGEQGFMLLAMIVAIFLLLLVLGIAAPRVAQDLRRDREVEAIHRGNEYVRAIRLYYKKFGHYPASMDTLEKSNNIRFLRQRYVDPITGKADWRIIKVGEAKTSVKGFFGQPLAGIASSGLGSAAGMSSNIGGGGASSTGTAGTTGAGGYTSGSSPGSGLGGSGLGGSGLGGSGLGGTTSVGGSSSPTSGLGSSGLGGGSSPTSGLGSSPAGASGAASGPGTTESMGGGMTSQSASTFTGSGAPFLGVGIPKSGDSIRVLNEQTTYQTWEFIYDPRIEQQAQAAALMGGGSVNNSSGFGSSGNGFGSSGTGFGTAPGSNGTPNSPGGFGTSGPSSPTSPSSPTGGTNPGSSGP